MQLQPIDKERYSKHFKLVFAAIVALLLAIALPTSTLLIYFFTDGEDSHFWLNLFGVVLAALVTGSVLRRYRQHSFMHEVMYVWDLKQLLNKIYRKQSKLKAVMAEGDTDAMQIMNYSYKGSRQLWELDNNTLTMEELNRAVEELDILAARYQVTLDTEKFSVELLDNY